MASWQTLILKAALRRTKRKVGAYGEDLQRLRLTKEKVFGRFPIPSGMRFEQVQIGDMDAEWSFPPQFKPSKVILYLHGGGYAAGSFATHRSLVSKICKTARLKAIAINYRLAPEHACPAAVEDAVEAYQYLLAQGYRAKDIIVMGDSAGGGLTAAMLLELKAAELEQPLCAVMMSPWTDLTGSGASVQTRAAVDPLLPPEKLVRWAQKYASHLPLDSPLVSPLFGNFEGVAPMFIQVGNDEIILDDSTRLAQKAKEQGVQVSFKVWQGMPHVWQFAWPFLPEAQKAIKEIASYVNDQIIQEEQRIKGPRASKMLLGIGQAALGIIAAAILAK